MTKITVKPADGLVVRKEDFSFLNPEGESVPLTKYIRRRLACGDMVEVTKATKKNSKSNSKSTKGETS